MTTTVISGGVLIDGTGCAPLDRARLVIRDGRVAAVGPAAAVALPDEVHEFLDTAGQYILPGLVDAHVHITIEGGPSGTFENDEQYNLLTTLRHARQTVEAGITTIRDLGGRNYIEFTVRRAVEAGLFPGPRMVLGGKIVSMTTPGALYWPGMYREADGPDEVRKATREQLKAGVDVVKVMATGSAMSPGEQPSPQYSAEEMRAAVEEAHKAGKTVAAHASGSMGIRNALEAGVDYIEHGSYLHEDADALALMARRGVFLVPTRKVFAVVAEKGEAAGISGWMMRQNDEEARNNELSLAAALAAGVPIAMGTDAGGPLNRHGENADELAYMVAAGMSPMQAIVAATRDAARCVGLGSQVGTLEVGKYADLLVVRHNPLDDVCVLADGRLISLVMVGGRPVRSELH